MAQALPLLREDLTLLPGPRNWDGAPTWTIHDPVRNRYLRIGKAAYDLLTFWHLGTTDAVARAFAKANGREPQPDDIAWLVHFLRSNLLVQRHSVEDVAGLKRIASATKTAWYRSLLHRYLFFRIPLVRPQHFLNATAFVADILFSGRFFLAVSLLGAVGLFLVGRQWDSFLSTFLHFFTWQGIVWYGGALIFAKICHELGHAYAATRAGCRVPTMGIAFLVMWPVLYTDTTDAWRLVDRRQRLLIDAAGMLAEVSLALIATFLWTFLPEGPLKSAAFLIATVTWIMTLAVNLNPFMRFDGYYLLSDILDIGNLQDRSFAQAKWWLRRVLFGFYEAAPEDFPKPLRRILILYAFSTWIYRLALFIGIALLVYGFFFKLLGIILFAVEITFFILLPVCRELHEIWKRRGLMRPNRNLLLSMGGVTLLLLVFFLPWRTDIDMPAFMETDAHMTIIAPMPARIESIQITTGQRVMKGQVLFTLASDRIDFQIDKIRQQIRLREELVRREAAGGRERAEIRVLRRDLESDRTRLKSLEQKRGLLAIRADMSGQIIDMDDYLEAGIWVNEKTPLATIANRETSRIIAYVPEANLGALAVDDRTVFFPERLQSPSIEAQIAEIAPVNTAYLQEPYLASIYGGPIAVEADDKKRLIPVEGIYRIVLKPTQDLPAPQSVRRGIATAEGPGQSLAQSVFNKIYMVLLRESGF